MKQALREAGVPTAASDRRAHAPTRCTRSPTRSATRSSSSRAPAPARWTPPGWTAAPSSPRALGVDGRRPSRSRSRSSSRATRASTTRSRSTAEPPLDFVSPLLPERAGGDADPLDLAAVRRHQPGRHRAGLRRAARAGPAGQRGARHRHHRHPHGVVLRPEGAALLRDRLPAAGRRRLGPLLGRQRDRPLPGVGRRDRARRASGTCRPGAYAAGIVALRPDRDGTITGYAGIDEVQARLGEWVIDAHLPPPGTPTQPVEAGYMANAYVRMRHPDYDALRGHARRRRPHRARARRADRPCAVTILGPQRRPDGAPGRAGRGLARSPPAGRSASPTTRSSTGVLGGGTVNLRLHARWLEVLDADRELATAELNHRAVLDELQELYALQVEHAERAADAVRRSGSRPRTRAAALADAESALRLLDAQHLARVADARADFDAAWRPGERDAVARHRAEVAEQVAGGRRAGAHRRARRRAAARAAAVRGAGGQSAGDGAGLVGRGDGADRAGGAVLRRRRADRGGVRGRASGVLPRPGAAAARAAPAAAGRPGRGSARWPGGSRRRAAWCSTTASGWTGRGRRPTPRRPRDRPDGRSAPHPAPILVKSTSTDPARR